MAKAQLTEAKNEVRQKRLECETLLRSLAESNRYPSADELFSLQQFGLGDPSDLKREVGRLSRKINLEQQAGTAEDRRKMADHCLHSEALLQKRTPELQKQIEDAQKELNRLQKDARLSAQRLEQMKVAADRLRDCLPESVKQEFVQDRAEIDGTLFRQLMDSETRLNEIRVMLRVPEDRNSNEYELWVSKWRSLCPGSFVSDGSRSGRWLVTSDWSKACNELQAELEILEPKLEQQREAFQVAVDALEAEMLEVVSNE